MITYKEVFKSAEDRGYKAKFVNLLMSEVAVPSKIKPLELTLIQNRLRDKMKLLELTLIQKWLRDKQNLHIHIDTTPVFDKTQASKYRAAVRVPFQPFRWTTGHYYLGNTYEQALLRGIHEALKLIKNEHRGKWSFHNANSKTTQTY
ncbi:MAG TPA: hypothetical protein VIQ04_01130 [Nitrososphaeraceae archaeon]